MTKDDVKSIIEEVEREKEAHFITPLDDKTQYKFHNSMPEKIGDYLNSLDSNEKIAAESKKIGVIARDLLKGL